MSILARVWWPALRDVTEQQARSTVTSLAWRRRTRSVVGSGLPWLLMVCLVPVLGCQDLGLTGLSLDQLTFETKTKDKSKERFDEGFDLDDQKEVQPPFIGDYVTVSGLNLVTLEGVGLVTGLDGTGGDPPPSQFRTQLLDDMRRRDIPDPNRIISSPSTALVIVRAYLPPLVQPGDRFDVEIRVPDGSTVTSLNGGWLLECRLTERAIVPGKGILEGKERARAEGPILVSTGEGSSNSMLRRGRIVGGGVGLESRDMQLFLKNDMRSVRNSTRIAQRVGTRFFSYDRYGHREPLAEAKTDQKIILSIHPRYKDNFPRYVQVIQNIAFRETEVERQVRMERLQKLLLIPEKAELASLQLEAIGNDAIPMLKSGLKADTLECRFYSAVALAYLGEADGLEVLYEAARDEPAFRVFALAAMSSIDEGETFMYLRQLMDNTLMETRYGAFRCMTTIDKQEPFVRGELLNKQCRLHVLDVEGEPMIHLTHRQKAEIVLFGARQEFHTPLALTAGPHIMVNSTPGSKEVVVSRYRVGEPDQRKVVSNRISDVLRAAAELGASYPDLAQLLVQAERQQNLPGQIGIDKLPEAGRYYERPARELDQKPTKKRIGRENLAPNHYTKGGGSEEEELKPLLAPTLPEEESVEEPVEEPAEAEPNPQEETAKSAKWKPMKSLRNAADKLVPQTHGELVYPEIREE
ncbi:MAG: flagellar basal body P-ring protein FlgI [Planctomycetaceae bacterium]|nr:flagellar basal body P-ring protein FlgI [Planctomycetaceae bacterium]